MAAKLTDDQVYSRVEIQFSERVGDGELTVSASASESKGKCRLGIDLASALERSGYPRKLLALAEAIDLIGMSSADLPQEIKAAHAQLIDAAATVVAEWAARDKQRDGKRWVLALGETVTPWGFSCRARAVKKAAELNEVRAAQPTYTVQQEECDDRAGS